MPQRDAALGDARPPPRRVPLAALLASPGYIGALPAVPRQTLRLARARGLRAHSLPG